MEDLLPKGRPLADQIALALLVTLAIAAVLLIADGGQARSFVTAIVVGASVIAIAGIALRGARGLLLVWAAMGALLGVAVVSLLGAGFVPFLMVLVIIAWLATSPHLRGTPRVRGAHLIAQAITFATVVLLLITTR